MKKLVLLMCLISYFSFAGIKSSKDNEIILWNAGSGYKQDKWITWKNWRTGL